MDNLINQAGFRVSPLLYQRILVLAQEPQDQSDTVRPSIITQERTAL